MITILNIGSVSERADKHALLLTLTLLIYLGENHVAEFVFVVMLADIWGMNGVCAFDKISREVGIDDHALA